MTSEILHVKLTEVYYRAVWIRFSLAKLEVSYQTICPPPPPPRKKVSFLVTPLNQS